eukprot:3938163-Rhodomonas_salina.2
MACRHAHAATQKRHLKTQAHTKLTTISTSPLSSRAIDQSQPPAWAEEDGNRRGGGESEV